MKFYAKIYFILILTILVLQCSNQKEQCRTRLETKGWGLYPDAESACLTYLGFENITKSNEEKGRSTTVSKILADEALVTCLYKTLEERKCDKKSDYIPHFGY